MKKQNVIWLAVAAVGLLVGRVMAGNPTNAVGSTTPEIQQKLEAGSVTNSAPVTNTVLGPSRRRGR